MPKVKVNDIEMYYESHGEGFPLITVIGFGGTVEGYIEETIQDPAKHFRHIVFDNRGTGRTDKPDIEYPIKMMADDLAGLMDALGIEKAHIAGWSMGGAIAQELVLNYSEKVEKLILGCTYCGGPNMIGRQESVDKFRTLLSIENVEEYIDYLMKLIYTQKYIEENKDYLLQVWASIKYPTPPSTLEKHLEAIQNHDTYDRLPKITSATLVLTGEEDVAVLSENSTILADRIPNAQLKTFKEAGHMFPEEKWPQVWDAMMKFLQ